jgi:hypothetical protein
MKNLNGANLSGFILLISMGLMTIFHIFVLVNVIPAGALRGGEINQLAIGLLTLEIITLFVTLIFTAMIAAKMEYIKAGKFKKTIHIGVWILFAFLILNIWGNLAWGMSVETLVFAPISLLLAICALRLAVEK